jgi:hypothetical protein
MMPFIYGLKSIDYFCQSPSPPVGPLSDNLSNFDQLTQERDKKQGSVIDFATQVRPKCDDPLQIGEPEFELLLD